MGVKQKKSRRALEEPEAAKAVDPLAGTAMPQDEMGNLGEVEPQEALAESATDSAETHVAPGCPDAGRIQLDQWARREPPPTAPPRQPRFQVIFRPTVLEEIHRHGKSNTDIELCGVIVGNVYHDQSGPYVLIEASIRGNAAVSKGTQVTFTSETWTRIHEVLEKQHPDCRIVGWYHTHPGFGIFLSGMDLFIQDHFFNAPWQVAFVYDPIGGDEGVFVWREGKAAREPHLLVKEPNEHRPGWLSRSMSWLRSLVHS